MIGLATGCLPTLDVRAYGAKAGRRFVTYYV